LAALPGPGQPDQTHPRQIRSQDKADVTETSRDGFSRMRTWRET
jgi:hypothetical protein